MPRPPETPDVRASKTLAYILRHGAEKEGLHIRSDGFIRLADVLARPKMRDIDLTTVLRLVSENAKQRFQLLYGYDPSPPPPKKKKVQQVSKKKLRAAKEQAAAEAEAQVQAGAGAGAGAGASKAGTEVLKQGGGGEQGVGAVGAGPEAGSNEVRTSANPTAEVDAAELDNLQSSLSKTAIGSTNETRTPVSQSSKAINPVTEAVQSTELPLVALPIPSDSEASPAQAENPSASASALGEYFIRATQGHSINLESTSHLEEIVDDEAGREKAGLLVHGTRWELWDVLKEQGLSRMMRQHIHLAPSFSGSIVPRPHSSLYIYLDLPRLLSDSIIVYVSGNGVVLTPGDGQGRVEGKYWKKAVRVTGGVKRVVWEEGVEADRPLNEGEE